MGSDVAISAALRQNLFNLTSTNDSINDITNILASGREVSSPLDDPVRFFAAQSLTDRATDLNGTLDSIGQSISIIQQATESNARLADLITQTQSIADQARQTLAEGAREARVTGSVDLSGVDDVTGDLTNVQSGDQIRITVSDPENPQRPVVFEEDSANTANSFSVSLSDGQSINQLIADINANEDTGGQQVIQARLNDDGGLEITALNGGNLRIEFLDADDTEPGNQTLAAATPSDTDLATALGFDVLGFENFDGNTATANTASVTAVASPTLQSLQLFDSSNSDAVAVRTTTLTNLVDSNSNDFGFSGGADSSLSISLNGEEAVTLELQDGVTGGFDPSSVTVQDFIDAINTDASLNTQIQASFDDVTGQISIRSIDASVSTVQFQFEAGATGATGGRLFGFGVSQASFSTAQGFSAGNSTPLASGSGNIISRTFQFGQGAAELLEQEQSFNRLRTQIDQLVENDAGFAGINLLNGDNLTTFFNADRTSLLETQGVTFTSAGLGISEADFGRLSTVNNSINEVRAALETSRAFGATLATDLGIVETRETFTQNTINNLEEGADKLTLADPNEQGARLLALQTRQQLAVTSLSLSAQSEQSVLRLF